MRFPFLHRQYPQHSWREIAWSLAPLLVLALLLVRLMDHQMWRDESYTMTLGLISPTLQDLFQNMRNDGHPAIWNLLIWATSKFSSNPEAMKIVQAVSNTVIVLLVWTRAPFSRIERLLLLFGYYFSFEFTVITRSYGLGLLFGICALSALRNKNNLWPVWIFLGLMANTSVYSAIWSIALALGLLFAKNRAAKTVFIPGAAAYLGMLALAVWTMYPAQDTVGRLTSWGFSLELQTLFKFLVGYVFGLFPVDLGFFTDLRWHWLPRFYSQEVHQWPKIWLIFLQSLQLFILVAVAYHSVLQTRELSVSRSACLVWIFGLSGVCVFAMLIYSNGLRHWGTLFLVAMSAYWLACYQYPNMKRRGFRVLLLVSLIGGAVAAVGQTQSRFSNAQTAALWIKEHGLLEKFRIGSAHGSAYSVFDHLHRPIFTPECKCANVLFSRQSGENNAISGSTEALLEMAALARQEHKAEAYLLLNWNPDKYLKTPLKGITIRKLAEFTGAVVPFENYRIYVLKITTQNQRDGGSK